MSRGESSSDQGNGNTSEANDRTPLLFHRSSSLQDADQANSAKGFLGLNNDLGWLPIIVFMLGYVEGCPEYAHLD